MKKRGAVAESPDGPDYALVDRENSPTKRLTIRLR